MNSLIKKLRISRIIDWLSTFGGVLAGLCIIITMLILCVEILLRGIAGKSTFIAHELSGFLLVGFVFLSLAYVLKNEGHIRITLITSRLPQRLQNGLELLSCVLSLAYVSYFLWWATDLAIDSYQSKEVTMTIMGTPLFIPKFLVSIGLSLFALQFVTRIFGRIKSWKKPITNDELL